MEHRLMSDQIHSQQAGKQATRPPAAERAAYEILTKDTKTTKPSIGPKIFFRERDQAFDRAQPSGVVVMDVRSEMELDYPATTASLLARYLIVLEGEDYSHQFDSANEV